MNKLSTLAANGNDEHKPVVIGIDLAKNVFAIHGINRFGKPVCVKPHVRRDQLLEMLAQLPPCIIGMEACSGAHHWARCLIELGQLKQMAQADERCRRLMQLTGIAHITATALVASIGNGHDFRNGRQLAAWLGLVPGQYGSGGKTRLGRITKTGDHYLRTLLIMDARSLLAAAARKHDQTAGLEVHLFSAAIFEDFL